jgi:predicted DNA binding CopG/RHH family protein
MQYNTQQHERSNAMKSELQTRPKHSVHTRMDLDVFETIRDYASARGLSVSSVINDVLARAAKAMRKASN